MKKLILIVTLGLVSAGSVLGQARLLSSELDSANDLFDVGGGTPFGNIDNPTHVTSNMWDNNVNTKATWFNGGGDGEEALVGIIGMPKRYVPSRFTLTMPGADADDKRRCWTNFVFEGSNDTTDGTNGTWETIEAFDVSHLATEWQTFRVFSWNGYTYNPDFVATNAYNSFRMRVTDPLSAIFNSIPHLSEVEIFGYEAEYQSGSSTVIPGAKTIVIGGKMLVKEADTNQVVNLFDNSDWWTPAEITTLGWWDATIISNISISVAPAVSDLSDISGNGEDLGQVTASEQPSIFRDHINYLNALEYTDYADQTLENLSFSVPASGNFSIFQVTVVESLTIFDAGLFSMDDGVPTDWQFQNGVTASTPFNGRFVQNGLGGSNGNASPAMGDGPSIYHLEFDFDDSEIRCYVDGKLRYTSPYTTKVGSTQALRIMGNRNSFGTVGGYTTETLIIDGTASNDVNKVVGQLAWKYGITGNLDASQQYKDERPLK